MKTLHLRKSDYRRLGPDEAEGEIGGSVLSDLNGDGPFFEHLPNGRADDYDFVYYLSRKQFNHYGGDGPVTVVAFYKEHAADQRSFLLNFEQFSLDIDNDLIDPNDIEEWEEVSLTWS